MPSAENYVHIIGVNTKNKIKKGGMMGNKVELKRQILENRQKHSSLNGVRFEIVSEKDEMKFDCKRCGKCCKGRGENGEQILVSPLDIYNGAKELGITAEEFADKYVSFHIGRKSGLVVGTLATDYKGTCKLLSYENGLAKCMIHKAKPIICALHPLGVIHGYDNIDEDGSNLYLLTEPCRTSRQTNRKIKISDITDNLPGTAEEIELAYEVRFLNDVVPKPIVFYKGVVAMRICLGILSLNDRQIKKFEISDRLRNGSAKVKKLLEEKTGCTLELDDKIEDKYFQVDLDMWKNVEDFNYTYSYCNYDTSKPFLEQCKDNYEKLKDFMVYMTKAITLIFDDITHGMSDENKKIIEEIAIDYGANGIDFGA